MDNRLTQFNDNLFPNLTIKQFAARQLQVPEERVTDVLFHALPADKQTPANKELLEKAMPLKVNASGAMILMVNTNHGLQLVYADSQRRKRVVSSNGSCEESESMAHTAVREFMEELGNPSEKGILCSIVYKLGNCYSLEVTNKIGKTAKEMASRMIETQADQKKLYINMSALYVNTDSVNIRHLEQEIEQLNEKLKISAPFYQQAVLFLYGDSASGVKAADFKDAVVRSEACKLINSFIDQCQPNITTSFLSIFKLRYDDKIDGKVIKSALSAIVDLTENKALGLISKATLEELLSLDLTQKAICDEFRKQYFMASFENILLHKDQRTPGEFLASLEKLASKVSRISLGLRSETVDTAITQVERKNTGASSKK